MDIEIKSKALIHFITNDEPCYVRIRNISTGLYIHLENNESNYVPKYMDYGNPVLVKKKNAIIGDPDGSIIIIRQSYTLSHACMSIYNITRGDDGQPITKNIAFTNDLSMLSISPFNDANSQFYFMGTLDELYICPNTDELNMFGEKRRYLYMSDDGYVHSDGDPSINSSLWKIEKLNTSILKQDIRTDYKKQFCDILKESKRNIDFLFPSTMKYFTFQNVGCKKNLCVSLKQNMTSTKTLVDYDSGLIGRDESTNFVIRAIPNENCVYISHYLSGTYLNIYTIPKMDDVFVGAPDCNWAKFYVIKKKNYYLFQCFHREADINGNYGRYLCMMGDDVNKVVANGCENDEKSMWLLKNN